MLPGLLVALHYARAGTAAADGLWLRCRRAADAVDHRRHGGARAGRRRRALATAWMGTHPGSGIALAVVAFVLIGLGVGAAGTSLLVLLAKRVDAPRRAAAATIVWLMMIAGFAVTAALPASCSIRSRRRACWRSPRGRRSRLPAYAALRSGASKAARGRIVRRDRSHRATKPSFREALRKSGRSRRRAASPSSSSSRCWPTARRT